MPILTVGFESDVGYNVSCVWLILGIGRWTVISNRQSARIASDCRIHTRT